MIGVNDGVVDFLLRLFPCRVQAPLTGRLMPDFKTIADFRKDNGEAIRKVCRSFVVLCRRLELFSEASVAIDGSKLKALNATLSWG